jgi:hypothetical protein
MLGGNYNHATKQCQILAHIHHTDSNDEQRVVSQGYVNQVLKESCKGPGFTYIQGNQMNNNSAICEFQSTALSTSKSCAKSQLMQSVSILYDANTSPPSYKMKVNCVDFCHKNQFFQGLDSNGNPKCINIKNCSGKGKVLVSSFVGNKEEYSCISLNDACENELVRDANNNSVSKIKVFNGIEYREGSFKVKCKTVFEYSNKQCESSNSVATGISFDLSSETIKGKVKCEKKGEGCPPLENVCQNGYLAPLDSVGFRCPGTKLGKAVFDFSNPLETGCTSDDSKNKSVKFFCDSTCGRSCLPTTYKGKSVGEDGTMESRLCYLQKDASNYTFEKCRSVGGTVKFMPLGGGGGVGDLSSLGEEKNAICWIPQKYDSSTFGRNGNDAVRRCTNCNFVDLNRSKVNKARKCPTGWKIAKNSNNMIFYQTAYTSCRCYNLADSTGRCNPHPTTCKKGIITSGYHEAPSSTDPFLWPGTFTSGEDHWKTQNDGWNCRARPYSFKCYSRILGIGCIK